MSPSERHVLKEDNTDHVAVTNDQDICVDKDVGLTDVAPDRGWAWCVLLGCFLSRFIVGSIQKPAGIYYVQFMDHYGQSAEMTSWTVSSNFTLALLLGPVASSLCNRYSVRAVVALGATLCTAGVLLTAFAPNIVYTYFSFGMLIGFGQSLVFGPAILILAQYFDKRRSLATGIATSGGPFSASVFPVIVETSFQYFGFFGTFLLVSAINCQLFVCAALFRPPELHRQCIQKRRKQMIINTVSPINSSNIHCQTEHISDIENKIPHQPQNKIAESLFSLFKNIAFMSLCATAFFFSLSLTITMTYLQALLEDKGIDAINAAYILTAMGIADLVSRIPVSMLFDLENIRQCRPVIFSVNMFVMSFAIMAMPIVSGFWQLCCVLGVYGVTVGLCNVQKSVICVDLVGTKGLANSFGVLLAFQGGGNIIAPIIGELVRDYLGRYHLAFYVSSIGVFLGGVVMAVGNVLFRH